MSNILPKEFTKDEKRVWFKKYPLLVKEIRNYLIENYNFKEINEQSNEYHQCELATPYDYEYKDGNGNKKKKPYIMVGFGKGWSFTSFTIVIQIIVFKKINLLQHKYEFVQIYPLHITPPGITNETKHGVTFTYEGFKNRWLKNDSNWFKVNYLNTNSDNEFLIDRNKFLDNISTLILNFYTNVIKVEIQKEIESNKRSVEMMKLKEKEDIEKEIQRKIKLEENKLSVISELDKDSNNEVDLVDDEIFNKILFNNQKNIIEIDKNYIQKFVKISMYLKTKRSNIQNIFITIKDTKNEKDLNELVNLLKNQVHTYDLLVFHSISMITSLVESDLISFYQIYECFDQLGVFNSNWENEVSNKLTNIGDGIKDLMYSIYQMENKIVNSIGKLTYVTQSSYNNLNLSIINQLRNINSSLDYSNYMTKIQNYKMFDIIL